MRVHFIAIGGSAMHNLAIALQMNGHVVSGSDDEIFEPSKSRLAGKGLLPAHEGWFPEKLNASIDAIILGMHARPDNPELLMAQQLGLNVYSYPEFLYQHARNKKRVVVGGSHGKTTITAMIMHVLKKAGMKFDYLVGSKLKDFDVMVQLTDDAPVMIFEGDEYLSSPIDRRPKFHWYQPHIALLSGIAWDHINVFPGFEDYLRQFEIFINLIEKGGKLVYNEADSELEVLAQKARPDIQKTIYSVPAHHIKNGVTYLDIDNSAVPLQIFGNHNLMNLNGALKVANELDISDAFFYEAIQSFSGTDNRLELVKQQRGNRVYKDFAHAPSKLRATVKAVREQFPEHHLVACFELHTFSSLNREFMGQYAGCFENTDQAAVYFNPHALQVKKLPELDESDVKDQFADKHLEVFNNSDALLKWLQPKKSKDVVYLFMSSGNFNGIDLYKLAEDLI